MLSFPSSNRPIPFFSVPDRNTISAYEPFRTTSAYLKARSADFQDIQELVASFGYSRKGSCAKFRRHLAEWNSLKRNIPLKYVRAIGARVEEIQTAVEVDAEEYESVLKLPFFPVSGIIRFMPTVYSEYRFEAGTTEDEAIEILKRFSEAKNLRACINFVGIKTIWIEPSGEVNQSFYYPTVTLTKTAFVPSYMGEGIGKAFIR